MGGIPKEDRDVVVLRGQVVGERERGLPGAVLLLGEGDEAIVWALRPARSHWKVLLVKRTQKCVRNVDFWAQTQNGFSI